MSFFEVRVSYNIVFTTAIALTHAIGHVTLKGTKREKLHAMHVKELIKTNYLNGNHIFKVSGLLVKKI